jgi:hypothetical protein
MDVVETLQLPEPRDNEDENDNDDDGTSENVNEAESIEKGRKMTMEERKLAGLLVVTQEETRIAVKVCYVMEYGEPDEEDWSSMIPELSQRFGVSYRVVRNVFQACRDGKSRPEKQKKGAGRKLKLSRDNRGLIAAAAALNGSASPSMATEICNATNKLDFPDDFETQYRVCRNTLISTLKKHTDYDSKAVLRRKTGKRTKIATGLLLAGQLLARCWTKLKLARK